jgi:hypothetical protein
MAKINSKDLFRIIDLAKQQMMNLNLPVFVSGKKIEDREIPALATLEAAIIHLSSMGLLKEEVDLDYTFDYDEPDIGPLEPK